MIILASENLARIVRLLETKYPAERDVYLTVLHAYDSVGNDEHAEGWAVYLTPESNKDKPVIMLPSKLPKIEGVKLSEIDIFESLAHEYCHHLQWCRGTAFDEDEADDFAEKAVDAFQLVTK